MTFDLLLEYKHIILSTTVVKAIERLSFSKMQLRLDLANGTKLFTREIFIENVLSEYSYHWQEADGSLIARWDKDEHHRSISSYPYHKHIKDENNIVACDERGLKDVLNYIALMV